MSSRFSRGIPSAETKSNEKLEAFATAAKGKVAYPWQDPGVRDDMKMQLNVAQSEPIMLRLDWLSYHTKRTKVDLVETALNEYFQKEFKRLGVPW